VFTGTTKSDTHTSDHIGNFHIKVEPDLSKELQKFWELEELPIPKGIISPEKIYCEELFEAAHERDGSGHYIVRLSAKEKMLPDLGRTMVR